MSHFVQVCDYSQPRTDSVGYFGYTVGDVFVEMNIEVIACQISFHSSCEWYIYPWLGLHDF